MNLQAELTSLDTSSDSVTSPEATSEAEGDDAPTESDVDAQQEMDDKDIFSSDIGSSTSEAVQEDKFWSFGVLEVMFDWAIQNLIGLIAKVMK